MRDRAQHGARLLAQIRTAKNQSDRLVDEQRAFGADVGNGVFLEFESEPGFQLPTESLENGRQRIELLCVKEVEGRTVATVFVPEGRLDHFERLVTNYLEQSTKAGRPRNEKLISQIQQIRLATVEALWTDNPELLLLPDAVSWWEVWLRAAEDRHRIVSFFKEYGRRLGLEIPDRQVDFPERTVVNSRGTKQQLARSMRLLNCIAELRKPKDTAAFFDALTATEQREWEHDLRQRTQLPTRMLPSYASSTRG